MLTRREFVSCIVAGGAASSIPAVFAASDFDLKAFASELQELVSIDSKTGYEEGVNKIIAIFEERFKSIGWTVTLHSCPGRGNALIATSKPDQNHYDVVLCAHADTVQPVGYAQKYPFVLKGSIAHGAGVGDDKSSLLSVWWICKGLPKTVTEKLNIAVIINPGEESSNPSTLKFFEREGKKTPLALVYEPGRGEVKGGGFVKVRKGSTRLNVRFHGKAAHSGNNPQDGRNAIYAMALAIPKITAIQSKYPGVTINGNTTKGGTAVNTIAAEAEVTFDFRFTDDRIRDQVVSEIRALCDKGFMDGVRSELVINRLGNALPETEKSRKLMAIVDQAAKQLGQPEPQWLAVGGASDGNKLAAQGAAVVCAMGVVSGNLHNPENEWTDLSTARSRIDLSRKVLELIAQGK